MAEEKKKRYRVYMALDMITEDEGNSLAQVNVMRMSNEPMPLPMMTEFFGGVSKLAPKVMCMQKPTYGKDNQRIKTGVDPDLDCDDFERGEASGMCDGMIVMNASIVIRSPFARSMKIGCITWPIRRNGRRLRPV